MRLQKRNTTVFDYRAYLGESEVIRNGLHSGNAEPVYDSPVQKHGSISSPYGFATNQLFGIDTKYTHILLMDRVDPDIVENGLIDWKGAVYEITAVRPSLNVLAVALKKRTVNNATDEDESDGG